MTSLPEYVALRSKYNSKYLQFVQEEGELHGFLRFSGDGALSPYTKFQVQKVSGSDSNLVHLRSCYNNKYWVPSDSWVVAEADEPEEDQTKSTCTLFQPAYVDESDSSSIRFMHVNLKKFTVLMNTPGEVRDTCLYLDDSGSNQDNLDVCTVIDWSSLVILPRNVAFKGGENYGNKYICARPANSGVRYLQFVGEDLADPTSGHEIFATSDGSVSIKSDSYEKFWTRTTSSYVLGDTEANDVTNKNLLFSPTLIQGNVIALKSVGNNDYCKPIRSSYPDGEQVIAVSAADATITTSSKLEYVERVTSKSVNVQVSDVRVSDVRVTVPKHLVLVSSQVVNASDKALDVVVNLSFDAEALTRTWSSTVNGSLKVGVNVNISSPIPVEINDQIEMTDFFVGDFVWGVEEAKSQAPTVIAYQVTVPAATKATVSAMGVKRLWDVPFSYAQTNTLHDGTETTFGMDDGIYTGTHTLFEDYNVEFSPIN